MLLTWVGSRDPGWNNPRTEQFELGPILSLLAARPFGVVYLFFNLESRHDDFRQRANQVLRYCQGQWPHVQVIHRPVDVISVTDYRELYRLVNAETQAILDKQAPGEHEYFVYLSPGTPQMQTVWVLLVKSGLLPARLIESTPPDLVLPGLLPWREVDLTLADFPEVIGPGERERLIGVLEAQRDNLQVEISKLRAELDLARMGSSLLDRSLDLSGTSLPVNLRAIERAYFEFALSQAGGNAAKAARLLGIEPAAYRSRAVTLGVRERSTQRK